MYKTSDSALVSALALHGFSHRETIQENRKVYFVYDETDELMDLVNQYYTSVLSVTALMMAQQMKVTKQMIYQVLDKNVN